MKEDHVLYSYHSFRNSALCLSLTDCCSRTAHMGFGTDLQGRASHEALLKMHDTELQLLECIKKFVTLRIKSDREYTSALSAMISHSQKFDTSQCNSPVFQVRTSAAQLCKQYPTGRCSDVTIIHDLQIYFRKKFGFHKECKSWNVIFEFVKLKMSRLCLMYSLHVMLNNLHVHFRFIK